MHQFWKSERPIGNCISEIIGCKCNTCESDMKKFLSKYGFEDVDVRSSEVSYQ